MNMASPSNKSPEEKADALDSLEYAVTDHPEDGENLPSFQFPTYGRPVEEEKGIQGSKAPVDELSRLADFVTEKTDYVVEHHFPKYEKVTKKKAEPEEQEPQMPPPPPRMRYEEAENTQQRIVLTLITVGRGCGYLLPYFFLPPLFVSLGYYFFNGGMDSDEFFRYGGNVYSTLGVIATIYILSRRAKKRKVPLVAGIPKAATGLMVEKSILFVIFGLATALALSAALTLLEYLPIIGVAISHYSLASMDSYGSYDLLFVMVSTVLLAPLAEEIIFRGYMLDTLLEVYPERIAHLIATIIFALCHINPVWICYAGVMGYLLSAIALREDGVYFVILCHMGFNLPSAIIYCTTTFSPRGAEILALVSVQVMIFLFCTVLAIGLAMHYRSQSGGHYQSIWRRN